MLGGARSATRTGRLRAPYPVFSYIPGGSRGPARQLDPSAVRIFQRQLELTRQRFDGGALPLPRSIRLEPQIADAASPRRDNPANRAVVTAVRVVLIESTDYIGRDADEGAQR